jgi:hypothetical protein
LVTEVGSPLLIEVDGEVLHKEKLMHQVLERSEELTIAGSAHGVDIWSTETGQSHDANHHMLLHIELPRVKTPGASKGGKSASRKDLL